MLLRSCVKSKNKVRPVLCISCIHADFYCAQPTSVEQQTPIKSRHRPRGLSQTTGGVTITHLYMKCRSHPLLVHIRLHRIAPFGRATLCGNSKLGRLVGKLSWTLYLAMWIIVQVLVLVHDKKWKEGESWRRMLREYGISEAFIHLPSVTVYSILPHSSRADGPWCIELENGGI